MELGFTEAASHITFARFKYASLLRFSSLKAEAMAHMNGLI
jgi:hypothetical protein